MVVGCGLSCKPITVFEFPNFCHHGNRDWSETNYIAQLHSLTPEQPLGYLVKNRERISYTR